MSDCSIALLRRFAPLLPNRRSPSQLLFGERQFLRRRIKSDDAPALRTSRHRQISKVVTAAAPLGVVQLILPPMQPPPQPRPPNKNHPDDDQINDRVKRHQLISTAYR